MIYTKTSSDTSCLCSEPFFLFFGVFALAATTTQAAHKTTEKRDMALNFTFSVAVLNAPIRTVSRPSSWCNLMPPRCVSSRLSALNELRAMAKSVLLALRASLRVSRRRESSDVDLSFKVLISTESLDNAAEYDA